MKVFSTTHPRVYIIHDQRTYVGRTGKTHEKDLTSAEKYGTLFPVLKHDENAGLDPSGCGDLIGMAMEQYVEGVDYICFIGGDPLALGLAFAALAIEGVVKVQFLRWEPAGRGSPGKGEYIPVTITI